MLELRANGQHVFRENARCSQGTGNFLRQLVGRFGLSLDEASALCDDVAHAVPLSGRCPVILKSDMTHLANRGEDRARILAGLYDAVCENVQALLRPRADSGAVMLIGGVCRSRRVRAHFRQYLAGHGMQLLPTDAESALFLEATGAAVVACQEPKAMPPLAALLTAPPKNHFERLTALSNHLPCVNRMPAPRTTPVPGADGAIVLGLDIGSTGSKAVALDARSRAPQWEAYVSTGGDPVGAARSSMRRFAEGPAGRSQLLGCGVTGSGREIVASLLSTCYPVKQMAKALGWGPRTTVEDAIAAGSPFVRPELDGEAILTVGVPAHERRAGLIDGVVNVGPLECMPSKIAEAQLVHVAEQEDLLPLTLPVNGDPVDQDVLDNFVFEVSARFRRHAAHP